MLQGSSAVHSKRREDVEPPQSSYKVSMEEQRHSHGSLLLAGIATGATAGLENSPPGICSHTPEKSQA